MKVHSAKELTKYQRLAAVMMLLGEETASLMLKQFNDHEKENVATEMANLPWLDLAAQKEILKEFTEIAVRASTSVSGSPEYAQAVLEKAVGVFKAAEIISRVASKPAPVASFEPLLRSDPLSVFHLIQHEPPQTIALTLSHLPPEKASFVLERLNDNVRLQVVQRLATLGPTAAENAELLGGVLSKRLGSTPARLIQSSGGFKAAAEVLKGLAPEQRQEILGQLGTRNPELVHEIKGRLFTFEDLVLLENKTLQRILREVDAPTLATALSAASDSVRDAFAAALSKRVLERVHEEIAELGKVRSTEVKRAQEKVMEMARRLEAEGRVVLRE